MCVAVRQRVVTGAVPAPRWKQYFKMLRMAVPKGGVKQKMRSEGFDPAIIDMDPDQPAPDDAAPSGPPLKNDPKYAKVRTFARLWTLGDD